MRVCSGRLEAPQLTRRKLLLPGGRVGLLQGSPSPHCPAASCPPTGPPPRECAQTPGSPLDPGLRFAVVWPGLNKYRLSAKAQPTRAVRSAGSSPPRRAEPTTAFVPTWWSLDWKKPRPSRLLSGLGPKPQSREQKPEQGTHRQHGATRSRWQRRCTRVMLSPFPLTDAVLRRVNWVGTAGGQRGIHN